MTEYLVLTMFATLACLYLLNPNTTLYQGLRRFYELMMRGVFFPRSLTLASFAMDTMMMASLVVLALLLSAAVYTELTKARIPNWLTLAGLGCGLLFGLLPGGLTLESSFAGLFVGFGVLFIFYVFGGMGGGDVKLMGAVGALVGFPLIVSALVYTAIIGGVMALVLLSSRAVVGLSRWARAGAGAGATATGAASPAPAPAVRPSVPYALAIAAGTLLVFYFGAR